MFILRVASKQGMLLEEQYPSCEKALDSARELVEADPSVKCCVFKTANAES